MAISHASIIHKPLDYTQPVNLDLLGRVLQFKQGQYDTGVAKVQQGIDNLASMDIVKGADRDYLNTKLSNLVQTTNNIGGADFSDPNVVNQIEGLSGQVYGDQNIIGAIANTRKFRYVQNYYQTLKEKHPKDWNPANEWYDMNKFSSWLGDGQVGSTPENGAGEVNPYVDYEKDWQNLFNKMKANATTTITDKGMMYVIGNKTYLSEQQIWDAASKLLTPTQRGQIGIEGRYTYQGVPLDQLIKATDTDLYNKISAAKGQLQDYKTRKLGATSLDDQEEYDKLIANKQKEIDGLVTPVKRNAEQLKEKLYLNEKLSGLASRYAFSQVSAKMQANTGAMFNARLNFDQQKFTYEQHKDAIAQDIEIANDGLMRHTDEFGNTTIVPDYSHPKWFGKLGASILGANAKGFGTNLSAINGTGNSSEDQKIETTKDKLDLRKGELVKDNSEQFNKFVQQFGWVKGFPDIEINSLSTTGHLTPKASPEVIKMANDMMTSWNALAQGKKLNFDKLDPLFKTFAAKRQENLKEIDAIDAYIAKADNQARDEFGITPTDKYKVDMYQALLNRKKEIERKYPAQTRVTSYGSDQSIQYDPNKVQREAELQKVDDLIHAQGFDKLMSDEKIKTYFDGRTKRRDELLGSANVRYNFPTAILNDDKNKSYAKMIATNAGTFEYYNENGEVIAKETLNPDNIEPMTKSYAMLKTLNGSQKQPVVTFRYKIKSGVGDDKYEIRKVPLNPTQAEALGLGDDVKDMQGYEFALHLLGKVEGLQTASGNDYDLKYDIVKYNPSNQNDPSVFLRIHKDGNTFPLFTKVPIPSYQQAINYMEKATGLHSYDEAMAMLKLLSDGKTTIPNK
jgi:hypothetical protein